MDFIIAALQLLIQKIFPSRLSEAILNRIHETRCIIDATKNKTAFKVLKFILYIVFYPLILAVNLFVFLLKNIVVWVLPSLWLRRLKTLRIGLIWVINEYRLNKGVRGFSFDEAFITAKASLEFIIKGRERTAHLGNLNPDKTFLVIRPNYYARIRPGWRWTTHLLGQYYTVLQNLEDAERHGWIPIIDWEHYDVPHKENFPIYGTTNAWEYYFEQPSQYTLEEVYKSRRVILSNQNILCYPELSIPHPLNYSDVNIFVKQLATILPKYVEKIPFNRATMEHFLLAQEQILPKGKKILGVVSRTTLAKEATLFSKHGKQLTDIRSPDVEILIKILKKRMHDWKPDYIFFTGEEAECIKQVKCAFGDKVLIYPRNRYEEYHLYSDHYEVGTEEDPDPLYRPGNRYQTNLDYLTEMYLLSQCSMLICSMTGGAKAAIMWNEGRYEKLEIIDLGTYQT